MTHYEFQEFARQILITALCIFCLFTSFLLPIAAFGVVAGWLSGQLEVKD